ncbi:ATP-binding protein [Ectopseudomonas mendocina]|uniref:ATP-binding protein n=1 Tax=Ectopseudomonas mendocina TaxID=300 RepID=UPI00376F37BB
MSAPKYTLKTKHHQVCEAHGDFDDHLIEQFDGAPSWRGCPRCHFDAKNSPDESVSQTAKLVQADRELNQRLLDTGIPPRFRPATLANYRTDRHAHQAGVLQACLDYAEHFEDGLLAGRSMLLLGTMGTGKTHLGCAVLQQVVRDFSRFGVVGRYVSAPGIIRSVKATFGKSELSEDDVYAELCGSDLLVIDEIGVQHGTDFERQVLFEVINARYERSLPTLAISNLNILELRKCVGDRVVDRLCDGGGQVVLFRWDSERGLA